PIAQPPPVGGHTGATTDPTTKPFAAILSANCLIPPSSISMLVCGSKRNRSTPSKRMPSTSAFAVRSSMVSRSMQGSAPGLPLPTRPGHMALCSFGKLLLLCSLILQTVTWLHGYILAMLQTCENHDGEFLVRQPKKVARFAKD